MFTLQNPATTHGIGAHSGAMARVRLAPGAPGRGITFIRTDVPAGQGIFAIPPDGSGAQLVQPSPLHTKLVNAHGHSLATIEHLMAALAGLAMTDVDIEIDGPEVSILDGSALPWVQLIDSAGRTPVASSPKPFLLHHPVHHHAEGRVLEALPAPLNHAPLWQLAVHIDFPHPAIGTQSWQGVLTEDVFRTEIAPARTFIEEDHLRAAQAAGLARGASLACGVLFNAQGGVSNPEGLRFADEPVRHKVLDALGDLYLAGRPIHAQFHLTAPGHSATNELLRKVLAS